MAAFLALGVAALGQDAEPGSAMAEDPADAEAQPYTVTIAPTGDADLDSALAEASQLLGLRETAPTGGFGLIARANNDRERLSRVLQAEGYWGGAVAIAIAGRPFDDPALAERLARPSATPVPVVITPDLRARYGIASIAVHADTAAGEAAVAAATAEPFGLAVGDAARIVPILAAERCLLDRLLAAGHPLATVARRDTLVDYTRGTMTVSWVLAPGPRTAFAPPAIAGTERVDPGFLARFAGRRLADEPYAPARLEQTRKALMALGPFESVRAEVGDALDARGQLPVTFVVAERPRRAIGGSVAYETNYGPSVRLYWEHRNLFGGAERLRLEGEVSRIGTGGGGDRSGLDQMTYRAFATLRDPGVFRSDFTLVANIGALRERLEAYDRDAAVGALLFEQWRSERLTLFAGPTVDIGRSGPSGGSLTAYQIAGVTGGARYDASDSLLDPSRGWRANAALTPSYNFADAQPFALLRTTLSGYWDPIGDRRTILAARTTFGSFLGANAAAIPIHMRFFAGGGGSVRGYDYQSIGPRNPITGKPTGGGSVLELGLEWRQRLWGDFGGVLFADAGTVGTSSTPDFSEIRIGAGIGLRYYTAIGPIRADVALPLIRQQGSSGYGLYIGIGQSF